MLGWGAQPTRSGMVMRLGTMEAVVAAGEGHGGDKGAWRVAAGRQLRARWPNLKQREHGGRI
jgi:hypothetical protein